MQRLLAYSLLFLYCAAMLRPLSPFVEYAARHDYIAKVLCINVDKPELQCNGACHLKKRIEATHQSNQEGSETLIQISDYPIGFPVKLSQVEISDLGKDKKYFRYGSIHGHSPVDDIFHPPQVCA